jgi:hypothetical protein
MRSARVPRRAGTNPPLITHQYTDFAGKAQLKFLRRAPDDTCGRLLL